MQKIRFWYWILEAWFKRHLAKIVVISILLIFIGSSVVAVTAIAPKHDSNTYIEGVVGAYKRTKLPPSVMSYVSKGLVSINDRGEPVGELAESITVEDGGKTFFIKLKQGMFWHDGTELTSADLAYNIPDVLVEKPDPYTLIFRLQDAFAPFPTLLTSPLIKVTPSNDFYGVGEYQVKALAFKETDYLTLLELYSPTSTPNKIVVKFYPTESDALTALKLGEIHALETGNITSIKSWTNLTIYQKSKRHEYVGIKFNMKDNLVGGKDPTIRHALSMAIEPIPDQEAFLGPFSRYSWAYTPQDLKYSYNLAKAQELIAKWKTDTNNPTLDITLSVRPQLSSTAEYIKQAWDKAGANTQVAFHDEQGFFQALLKVQELPVDPDQYNLWHSTQTQTNITGYNNVRADRDLEEARRTVDQAKRKEKYADFQKIILEELPVIYLYHPPTYIAIMKKHDNQAIRTLKKVE